MSAKEEDFVWRFSLNKTRLRRKNTADLKIQMVRQQVQNLLNLIYLFQNGKRLRPTSFSFIGDRRVYQIFEGEERPSNSSRLDESRAHVQRIRAKHETNKSQTDSQIWKMGNKNNQKS